MSEKKKLPGKLRRLNTELENAERKGDTDELNRKLREIQDYHDQRDSKKEAPQRAAAAEILKARGIDPDEKPAAPERGGRRGGGGRQRPGGGRGPAGGRGGRGGGRGPGGHGRGGPARGGPGRGPRGGGQSHGDETASVRDAPKGKPEVFGLPFHNPYTFIPFPKEPPARRVPTSLTVDEIEKDRLTGVIELDVTTTSPLMTCAPEPVDPKADHKTYRALTIGDDVVVPATGVRGALRTLMTVLTGGTLGFIDPDTFLCQGRDANLGPQSEKNRNARPPKNAFLAQVERPGDANHGGTVLLGETRLVSGSSLEEAAGKTRLELRRPRQGGSNGCELWARVDGKKVVAVAKRRGDKTPWRIKLSGRPVGKPDKSEGAFLPDPSRRLTLPPALWRAYAGRYRHADHAELKRGDLVWLEPAQKDLDVIREALDVASIQWARLGRHGQELKDAIPPHVLPDYVKDDGLVDEVTDLFGQVAPDGNPKAPSFAGRIRPENLVFRDAAGALEEAVDLAPLAVPHPGCLAFYRDCDDADAVSEEQMLRGYKVYRASKERGANAPWRFETQGIYDDQGRPRSPKQKMCKAADLVPEGRTGSLRISFRALSGRELALLLQVCSVPWRLGGGKPLGLGCCSVGIRRLVGEDGNELPLPAWENDVEDVGARVKAWVASQEPVELMRYPRHAVRNRNKINRGGNVWFNRHAKAHMSVAKSGERPPGIDATYVKGELAEKAGHPHVSGQLLPRFDADDPQADVLHGYDGFGEGGTGSNRDPMDRMVAFDPAKHATGDERSGGHQGQDANTRKAQKKSRGPRNGKRRPPKRGG